MAPGWRCAAGDMWLKIALLVPMSGGAHSTIALVFSTEAWHGQKRSSSGHGHKCQGRDTKRHQHRVGEIPGEPQASAPIWTNLLNHRPQSEHLQENVTW